MKVLFHLKQQTICSGDVRRKVAQGRLDVSYFERLKQDDDFHHSCRRKIIAELDKQGIVWVEISRGLFWPDLNSIDAVISVGGDGTVLEASHHIHTEDIPLIGIKSSPMSVGKLCAYDQESISKFVDELKSSTLNRNFLALSTYYFSANWGRNYYRSYFK